MRFGESPERTDVSPAPTDQRSPQTFVLGAIVLLTVLAWAYLLHLHAQMSGAVADAEAMRAMGMPMDQPWTLTDVGFAFVMWAVMMAGMMSPSAAPVLLVVARAASARGESSRTTILFGAGYFAVWTGFSAIATLAQWVLHNASLLSSSMAAVSPRAAGIALVLAGLYQLTPEKRACLQHCRNPIDFLMTAWRPGAAGSFWMGAHHGLYCLGCCWALMIVLFAVGLMNLVWVAAISALVLLEKTAWGGVTLARATGVLLILVGGYSAL
jgi:predicted metal-binding membrane protein